VLAAALERPPGERQTYLEEALRRTGSAPRGRIPHRRARTSANQLPGSARRPTERDGDRLPAGTAKLALAHPVTEVTFTVCS
jgi:hypothetical protein